MTIRYTSGRAVDGIVLTQTGRSIRVAVPDCEDTVEFTAENGMWFSEDWEPVELEFAWERRASHVVVSEADCICPKGLASVIIQLLRSGSDGNYVEVRPKVFSMAASFC